MAELRLLPLDEILAEDEVETLLVELDELGVEGIDVGDEVIDLEEEIDDDAFADFLDRLEARDIACTIYLPTEFDGVVELPDVRVGSAFALADALEELRDELDIEGADRELADDEELEMELVEEQLSHAWKVFARAANACVEHKLPIHVVA